MGCTVHERWKGAVFNPFVAGLKQACPPLAIWAHVQYMGLLIRGPGFTCWEWDEAGKLKPN